ncbi:F-box DNA helicase 1-like [Amphiura filiformis]|uniref:F-box DNA helicase 1-like n=1 Tax=Amphiura filiformis TaxID=82378 RepID=UPI003B20CD21
MPILDLSLGVNLVCQSWKDIINRKKYLRWKKRYHKYKVLEETACAEVFSLIVAYQMTCKEAFLLKIIRYVQKFRKWFGSSMVDDLKQHHNYELAKDLFEQRAPELIKDGIPNPWCLIAALAILAETVADVTLIIKCLLNPMATCTALDVTECLYCVATLLLRLQRKHNANRGLHYRVFYALYLYENSFSDVTTTPSKAKKQRDVDQKSLWQCGQNSGGVRLTHEQMRIVTYDPKPNEVIKVIAFAGTGKTTTLVRYAQRRPHMKFLYVAFNRTVKQHAEKVFPSNVTCKTTHSLAYWAVGIRYAESSGKDDKRIQNNLVIHKVNNILPKENLKGNLDFIGSPGLNLSLTH